MRLADGKVLMSEAEYAEFDESNLGVCLNCGATRDGCEPDAREYSCEACDANAVYGAQELMMMGKIELAESDDE
jgi:hypothetical protein